MADLIPNALPPRTFTAQLRAQLEAAGKGQAQLSAAGAEVTALKEAQQAMQVKLAALKAERDEAKEVSRHGCWCGWW